MKNIIIIGISLLFVGCSSLVTRGDLRRCSSECSEMGREMSTVKSKDGKIECLCKPGQSHMNDFDREELGIENKSHCQ